MCNDRRHQNALKHWCFRAFFGPLKGFSSAASRGEECEKHRLENTVGKTDRAHFRAPFREHCPISRERARRCLRWGSGESYGKPQPS